MPAERLLPEEGQVIVPKKNKLSKRELRSKIEAQFGKLYEFSRDALVRNAKVSEYDPDAGIVRFEGGYGQWPDLFIEYVLLDRQKGAMARREVDFRHYRGDELKQQKEIGSLNVTFFEGDLLTEYQFVYSHGLPAFMNGAVSHRADIDPAWIYQHNLAKFTYSFDYFRDTASKEKEEIRLKLNKGSLDDELAYYRKRRKVDLFQDKDLQVIIGRQISGHPSVTLFYPDPKDWMRSGVNYDVGFNNTFSPESTRPYAFKLETTDNGFSFVQLDTRNNTPVSIFLLPGFTTPQNIQGILLSEEWTTLINQLPFKLIMPASSLALPGSQTQ